jgi:hypothetical protein
MRTCANLCAAHCDLIQCLFMPRAFSAQVLLKTAFDISLSRNEINALCLQSEKEKPKP